MAPRPSGGPLISPTVQPAALSRGSWGTEDLRTSDLRVERVGLALAVLVTIVYGANNLDATPLWLDEAYTLGAVNRLGASLRGTHGTMGLYYTFMWFWGLVSTATWWLRLPSLLFSLASLVVLRPVARRVGGPRLVALALPIAALGPMFAWKATEARGYALETLITCVAWFLLLRAMDSEANGDHSAARRMYLLMIPLFVGGVLAHGLFVMQIVPLGVVALIGPSPRRSVPWMAPAVLAASAVVAFLLAVGAGDVGTNIHAGPGVQLASTFEAFLSAEVLPRLVLSLLALLGLYICIRRARLARDGLGRALAAVPAAWAILPGVALALPRSGRAAVFNPRYLAPIGPGLALLIAVTLLVIENRLRASAASSGISNTPWSRVVSVATLAIMTYALVTAPPYVEADWRGTARLIASEGTSDDGIIFPNLSAKDAVQHRPPFEAAWREVPHGPAPTVVSPPRPLGEVRRFDDPLTLQQMVDVSQDHDRVWLIDWQESGGASTVTITQALENVGFTIADQWLFDRDLSVLLLVQQEN